MDLGLTGATAVIIGGTKGMGRATAELFACEGARVAVLARNPAELKETVAAPQGLRSPCATEPSVQATVRACLAEPIVRLIGQPESRK